MRTYSVTYEIVTEESARDGDVAERGFLVRGDEIPLPPEIIGDAARQWFKDHEVDTPVNPEDWTGSSAFRQYEDYPCERYAASVLLDLPCDVVEGNAAGWFALYPSSDEHWAAETEDGTPGTRSLGFHLDGWTDEELNRIDTLVYKGNANAEL